MSLVLHFTFRKLLKRIHLENYLHKRFRKARCFVFKLFKEERKPTGRDFLKKENRIGRFLFEQNKCINLHRFFEKNYKYLN